MASKEYKGTRVPVSKTTLELIDSYGNAVYTDGKGLQVIISDLWHRPITVPLNKLLEQAGFVRATRTIVEWDDGTKAEYTNIGEYEIAAHVEA